MSTVSLISESSQEVSQYMNKQVRREEDREGEGGRERERERERDREREREREDYDLLFPLYRLPPHHLLATID